MNQQMDTGNACEIVLSATGISKEFPGVKALSNVDLEVRQGEVLALLGENGAGKSTLIKILSGVYSLDTGSVTVCGQNVRFNNPLEAKAAGIGIIHQELNYVATVSVAENIFMGDIPKKGFLVDYKKMHAQASEIMRRIGLDIDPKKPIGQCSVAEKQLIEIAKVISHDVKVLIMDEPTSALNDIETENLFEFVKQAAQMGISIIYISHKLEEIFRLADNIVVLRDGQVTGRFSVKQTTQNQLITAMVGRSPEEMYVKQPGIASSIALEVRNLSTHTLNDISFTAHKGEILGIFGLMGSGHQEIGSAIVGQQIVKQGELLVNGNLVHINSPVDAINNGISYVPAERKTEGLVLNNSVQVNTMVSYYAKNQKKRLIDKSFEEKATTSWVERLRIKTPSIHTRCEALSGGNQQKVVIAKCLEVEPEILILNEPTRGIDVGAKTEIYRILDTLLQSGKCIIMITSEMPELLAMADKIIVFHEGHISGMLSSSEATPENVLKYAIGG